VLPCGLECCLVLTPVFNTLPVTVAERSEMYTVFARSEARIVGSNPTQGMGVLYVYVFILCLCHSVFR
jgi:hypothetical protein